MTGSDGFFVDPDALSGANADVGRLLREMDDFGELKAEDTASIHQRLTDTVAHYRRLDEEIAAGFDRLRDGRGDSLG